MADKNVHAAALSKLGAKKGGNARAHRLSPLERSQIAKKGADQRWHHTAAKAAKRK